MNRRQFLQCAAGFSATLALSNMTHSAVAKPPNILFIMADDHTRAAMSCYGSRTIQTPHLDRLASQGMKFTHMTVTNPLCAPSRAILLTGKHSHINGYRKNKDHFDGSQQTFPKLMQQAGYETAIVGKWHLYTEPTGFDHYLLMPGQGRFYNCRLKEKGKPWKEGSKGGEPYEGYLTDVLTDQSIAWLEERSSDKPFCLMLHHKAPHGPHDPAPRHASLFESDTIPEPPTLLDDYKGRVPEKMEDKLSSSRMAICRYPQYKADIKKFAGDREKNTRYMYQTYMKGYLRLVAALDENIGRLMAYLDESGLSENTLVVYTSDNGFFNGEHGFFNKMWMYEPSLRPPLLVRYPRMVQAGITNTQFISMLDFAPTFLDLAGASIPEDMQGASFLPLLQGKDAPWRDSVYCHYYAQYNVPEYIGVSTKRHKLIYYPKLAEEPKWEFFDLQKDPNELVNCATDPVYAETLAAMKVRLRSMCREVGDTDTTS